MLPSSTPPDPLPVQTDRQADRSPYVSLFCLFPSRRLGVAVLSLADLFTVQSNMAQPPLSRLAILNPQNLAESVLFYAQIAYPFVLLVAFGVALGLHSILTSTTQEDVVHPDVSGPGGRPLPVTKKRKTSVTASRAIALSQTARHVFQYGTAAVVISFLANGINICLHATAGGWWCNDEQIVRHSAPHRHLTPQQRAD